MGSSFCDPTREVCPFGAAIDPTLALVNNVYSREAPGPVQPGIVGPMAPTLPGVPTVSTRQAPLIFTGGGITWPSIPPINIPISFGGQQPGPIPNIVPQRPPLLPGRIPPAPVAVQGGCPSCNGNKCSTRSVFVPVQNGCCPKGCHPDKKTGTKCVSNRRMNPLNPRALRRSLRRIDQFENFVNKTAKLTGLRLAKKSTRRK